MKIEWTDLLAAVRQAKRYYPADTPDGARMREVTEGQSVWVDIEELLATLFPDYRRKEVENNNTIMLYRLVDLLMTRAQPCQTGIFHVNLPCCSQSAYVEQLRNIRDSLTTLDRT